MQVSIEIQELNTDIGMIESYGKIINEVILETFWDKMAPHNTNSITNILKLIENLKQMKTALEETLKAIPLDEFDNISKLYKELWIKLGNVYAEVVGFVYRNVMKVKGLNDDGRKVEDGLSFVFDFWSTCEKLLEQANKLTTLFKKHFEDCKKHLKDGSAGSTKKPETIAFLKEMENQKNKDERLITLLTAKSGDMTILDDNSSETEKAISSLRHQFREETRLTRSRFKFWTKNVIKNSTILI